MTDSTDAAAAATTTTAAATATTADEPTPMKRHVGVCAFPFGTHPASLLHLVRRIADSAPDDVSVVFSFFSSTSSNATLFSDGGSEKIQPYNVEITEEGNEANEVDRYLQKAPEALKKSMLEAETKVGAEIACVLSDAFVWFSRDFAEEKSVPWLPFWTAGPASLSAHVSSDLFRTKFGIEGIEGKEQESADLIPGFSSVRAGDLPHGIVGGDLDSPRCQMLHNVGLNMPKANAISINSFQELDPMVNHDLHSKLPELLNTGPFPLTIPQDTSISDEHDCIGWLDNHKEHPSSVIYISFGTLSTPSKDDIIALAEALESNGSPFLLSLRKEVQDFLPEGFTKSMVEKGNKIVLWAPQNKVLGHPSIGAFVTHCGWNSVLESIVHGVPMVCMPILHDQFLNSRFVDNVWKIGVRVERENDNKLTKEGVEKAITRVMKKEEEEGKTIIESIQALKKKAEEAAKSPDGSSIKDIEKLAGIVMGTSKNDDNKDNKKDKGSQNGSQGNQKSWKKWFKVFRVWKR